jgi:hypothetical protein
MRRIGILIVITLLLPGCGSSGGAKSSAPEPSTTSTTAAPLARGDRRVIVAGLIRPSDLPGFRAAPASTNAADVDQVAKGLPECANYVAKHEPGANKEQSPGYTRDREHARDAVDAYPTVEAVNAQLDLYQDPTTVDCFHALYLKAITASVGTKGTVDNLSVSPIAVENLGDGQFGFRLTVNLSSQGRSATLTSDIIGIIVGRFGLQLDVDGTPAQLAELETTLLPTLVGRMQQAGA